jgi:hypothetical protein
LTAGGGDGVSEQQTVIIHIHPQAIMQQSHPIGCPANTEQQIFDLFLSFISLLAS